MRRDKEDDNRSAGIERDLSLAAVYFRSDQQPPICCAQWNFDAASWRRAVKHEPAVVVVQHVIVPHEPALTQNSVDS